MASWHYVAWPLVSRSRQLTRLPCFFKKYREKAGGELIIHRHDMDFMAALVGLVHHDFSRSLTPTLSHNSTADHHNFTARHTAHGHDSHQDESNSRSQSLPYQRSHTSFILLLIALSVVAAWVFVTNALVIYGLLKKSKSERSVLDVYYLNLSMVDVVDGAVTLPFMGSAILHGEFLWGAPCQLWIFVDYSLIIGSSIGFMALVVNYLLMVRRPTEFKQVSGGQHQLLIILMWVITIVIWIPAFLNNYVVHSIQQQQQHTQPASRQRGRSGQGQKQTQQSHPPQQTCGFDVHTNNYYTLYIAIVAFYVPLIVCIASAVYSALILRRKAHERLFYGSRTKKPKTKSKVLKQLTKLTLRNGNSALNPFQIFQNGQNSQNIDKMKVDLGTDVDVGSVQQLPLLQLTRAWSRAVILETNHILNYHRHAKKELPLIIALLTLFVLSRTIYYIYFGVGAFVPSIFPRNLSTSVYWILQIQGCFAPILHLSLDERLRHSIQRHLCAFWRRRKWWTKAKKKQGQLQSIFAAKAQIMPLNSNNNIILVKPKL